MIWEIAAGIFLGWLAIKCAQHFEEFLMIIWWLTKAAAWLVAVGFFGYALFNLDTILPPLIVFLKQNDWMLVLIGVVMLSVFGVQAAKAAYKYSQDWVNKYWRDDPKDPPRS